MEDNWRWVAITAIAPIVWGANYFVTRQFLPVEYPLWGSVLRALPAGLLLLAATRSRPRGSWWWKSVVLGTLNVGVFFVLVYVAAQLLASSIAATLMATSAGVMMLLAWPLLHERPALLSLAGVAVGFAGVCIMLLDGGVRIDPLGVAASLAAMALSSVGFVLTKRWSDGQRVPSMASWQLIAGGLVLVPFAMAFEGRPPPMDAVTITGLAYVAVIATALAYAAWFTGLRHLPAGKVGLVGLLNPVTGVVLGTLVASEPFGIRQAVGAALVLGGVLLGERGKGPADQGRPPAPIARPRRSTALGAHRVADSPRGCDQADADPDLRPLPDRYRRRRSPYPAEPVSHGGHGTAGLRTRAPRRRR